MNQFSTEELKEMLARATRGKPEKELREMSEKAGKGAAER